MMRSEVPMPVYGVFRLKMYIFGRFETRLSGRDCLPPKYT